MFVKCVDTQQGYVETKKASEKEKMPENPMFFLQGQRKIRNIPTLKKFIIFIWYTK